MQIVLGLFPFLDIYSFNYQLKVTILPVFFRVFPSDEGFQTVCKAEFHLPGTQGSEPSVWEQNVVWIIANLKYFNLYTFRNIGQ